MSITYDASDLAKEIYSNEGVGGLGMSYNYIKRYLGRIEDTKLEDFYKYNFDNYSFSYNIGLLASTVDVYKKRDLKFWEDILCDQFSKRSDNFGDYDFFKKKDSLVLSVFMYKFLKLNSLILINRLSTDKRKVIDYLFFFQDNFSILDRDREFYENFEDGFYQDLSKFDNLYDDLINTNPKLKIAIFEKKSYNIFINSLIKELNEKLS